MAIIVRIKMKIMMKWCIRIPTTRLLVQARNKVKSFYMLEKATATFAFTSGMAALAQVVRLVGKSGVIFCGNDIYGGMYRYLTKMTFCSEIYFIPTYDLRAVEKAILKAREDVEQAGGGVGNGTS